MVLSSIIWHEKIERIGKLSRPTAYTNWTFFCFFLYTVICLVLSSNTKFALHIMAAVFTLMNNHIGLAATWCPLFFNRGCVTPVTQLTALAGRLVGEEGCCKNVFFSPFSWMSCHQESLVNTRVYIVLLIDFKCSDEFLGLPTALNYRLGISANSAKIFG